MKPDTTAGVIRVLLISSFEIARRSLRLLLESRSGIHVVEAASCRAALEHASTKASLVLFDQGPDSSADLELLPQVVEAWGSLPLLVLAGTRDAQGHCVFLRLGVRGLVLKTDPVENLFRAVERLNARELWFEGSLIEGILAELSGRQPWDRPCPGPPSRQSLTARETEVTRLVGEALTNRQIAQRLFISETTVRHHLNSVFGKLGVSSRLELMKYVYCSGLAKPTPAITRTAQIAHSA